jgi:hypothetical protein
LSVLNAKRRLLNDSISVIKSVIFLVHHTTQTKEIGLLIFKEVISRIYYENKAQR